MNGKELFCIMNEVDDRYLSFADDPTKEQTQMKHTFTRKTFTLLAAVLVCVSMLAVTAMASGWLPGIFRSMAEKEPADQTLYEAAAQANSEALPESQEIPYLDYSNFILFERYYDGETILLGYDMSLMLPEPVVGYTPETEEFNKIKEEIQSYNSVADLRQLFSEDAYTKAQQIMEEAGYVCIVAYDVWVGDHIYVNGTDIGEVLSETVWSMREDYETEEGSCIRLNPLPEAGRDQDSVTVTLKIKSCQQYWYFDTEGNCLLFKTDDHQEELMDFVLENANSK